MFYLLATTSNSGKLSLMHFVDHMIKGFLVWHFASTEKSLDDCGRKRLNHLPLSPGHLVKQGLWQMLLNESSWKLQWFYPSPRLNNMSYNS